jgi:hypothetical protein
MRSRIFVSLLSLTAIVAVGCDNDPDPIPVPGGVPVPPDATPGGEGGTNEPPPPMDMGGIAGVEVPPPPERCNAYEYRGMTYDCSEIDLCSPDGVDPVVASICAQCYASIGFPGWANQPCPEIDCDDGQDNDGDGYVDCDDQDCGCMIPQEPGEINCAADGAC